MDVQQPCSSGTSSSSLLETIDTTMDASNKLPTYCYCNGPEGEMVGCDNILQCVAVLLGGSHTYQSGIRRAWYYVRTLRAIIIIKALLGYYSRAATILLSSSTEL